jgi:hypothetical protein
MVAASRSQSGPTLVLRLSALLSPGSVPSASRGFATIMRLVLVNTQA